MTTNHFAAAGTLAAAAAGLFTAVMVTAVQAAAMAPNSADAADLVGTALSSFFTMPLSSRYYIGMLFATAAVLMTASTGSALSLSAGAMNLGGEGQIYLGGFITAVLLSRFPSAGFLGLATASLAAMTAAGIGAFFAGILKNLFRIPEMITTYLISAALIPILDYMTGGPFRDVTANMLATAPIADAYKSMKILHPSPLTLRCLAGFLLPVPMYLFLRNTRRGRIIMLTGKNYEFTYAAGLPSASSFIGSLTISGMLHGLAGFIAVAGIYRTCFQGFSSGLGWNALAVALIARGNPLTVIPATFVYAYLIAGSESAAMMASLSFNSTAVIQAAVFLFVTVQTLRTGKKAWK